MWGLFYVMAWQDGLPASNSLELFQVKRKEKGFGLKSHVGSGI